MNLNPIGVLQITGYMIQVGVYEAFGDAEYPQAFYKVLFPVSYTHLDVYKRQVRER